MEIKKAKKIPKLPHTVNLIMVELRIAGDDCEFVNHGLANEHTVKRVTMVQVKCSGFIRKLGIAIDKPEKGVGIQQALHYM